MLDLMKPSSSKETQTINEKLGRLMRKLYEREKAFKLLIKGRRKGLLGVLNSKR